MVIVFDLDDTLYEELTYVKSGFKNVSIWLEERFDIPSGKAYKFMLKELNVSGRGKIFNAVLEKYGQLNRKNIRKCLSVYRLHQPDIKLPKLSQICLQRFADYPVYIVTDGNKLVQHKKVEALGLYSLVKKVFITHHYGVQHAKPSPYCFQKIAKIENVPNDQIVYIGDNARKDFIGIKPLGFKTIQVLTGNYKDDVYSKAHEAHTTIKSLKELNVKLINSL